MKVKAETPDTRGYTSLHRAFDKGSWKAIKGAIDGGVNPHTLTTAGTDIRGYAEGLGQLELLGRLERYIGEEL